MQRFHQLLFTSSLAALAWFTMMAVHELGHIIGALATGGSITHLVLHPLRISRTDVFPNPHPAIVVWLGPITGLLLPLLFAALVPRRMVTLRKTTQFFAGFCLIANGAYVSGGCWNGVGDCGEMLRTGTPAWAMYAFGGLTIPLGLFIWHRLGSLKHYMHHPAVVPPKLAWSVFAALVVLLISEMAISPR